MYRSIFVAPIFLLTLGCTSSLPMTQPTTTTIAAIGAARVIFDGAVVAVDQLHTSGIINDADYLKAKTAEAEAQIPLNLMENYLTGQPVDWATAEKDFWTAVAPLLLIKQSARVVQTNKQIRALEK